MIQTSDDVARVRVAVRQFATALGLGEFKLVRLVTAASELSRNIIDHGVHGRVTLERAHSGEREGIRLRFEDHGPGIADVKLAMQDGFSSRNSLGLGLGGTRRLVDEFEITSKIGQGTVITVVQWR